jgi:hypothetical protein
MAKGSCNRMGELEPWIDEAFIRSIWFGMGEQVNVKMIRDKFSGYVVGCDAILIMKKKIDQSVVPMLDTVLLNLRLRRPRQRLLL